MTILEHFRATYSFSQVRGAGVSRMGRFYRVAEQLLLTFICLIRFMDLVRFSPHFVSLREKYPEHGSAAALKLHSSCQPPKSQVYRSPNSPLLQSRANNV